MNADKNHSLEFDTARRPYGNSNPHAWNDPVTRRRFLKRTGGATITATLLANLNNLHAYPVPLTSGSLKERTRTVRIEIRTAAQSTEPSAQDVASQLLEWRNEYENHDPGAMGTVIARTWITEAEDPGTLSFIGYETTPTMTASKLNLGGGLWCIRTIFTTKISFGYEPS